MHSALLAIAAAVVWRGFGVVTLPLAVVVGTAGCLLLRPLGIQWVRLATFLSSVAIVVLGGLAVERTGLLILLFVALLLVLLITWAMNFADPDGNAVPVSLSFYAALVLAFFLLGGFPEAWPPALRFSLAAISLALGLFTWIPSAPTGRFRKAQAEGSGGGGFARIAALLVLILLLAATLFAPLPWAGSRAVEAGEKLREWVPILASIGDRLAGRSGKGGEQADPEPDVAPGVGMNFGRRRELPMQADLQLGDDQRLFVQIPDRAQFVAMTKRQNYVRSLVLDRYSAGVWEQGPQDGGVFFGDADDGVLDGWVRIASGGGVQHEVFLPAAGGAGLPALQNAIAFRLDLLIRNAPDMYEAELRGAIRYGALSRPQRWEEVSARRPQPGQAPGRSDYLQTADGEFGDRLQTLTAGIIESARTPAERLDLIKAHLRARCRYDTRVENPDSLPPLENFLFGERVGFCDFFASAAVLLAREAGFPARMAYGFSGGESFPEQQLIVYRASDAHAWAEVYLDGIGWVVFDATPSGQGAARAPSTDAAGAVPDLSGFREAERENPAEVDPDAHKKPMPTWLRWGLMAAVGVGVALVALHLARRREGDDRGSGKRSPASADRSLPAYLREFLRLCREFGRPRGRGETLLEASEGLVACGFTATDLRPVVDYHYSVSYADADRDRDRESELKRLLRDARKQRSE